MNQSIKSLLHTYIHTYIHTHHSTKSKIHLHLYIHYTDSSREPLKTVFIVISIAVGIAFIGLILFGVMRERGKRALKSRRRVPRANRNHGGAASMPVIIHGQSSNHDEDDGDLSVIVATTDEEGGSLSLPSHAVNDFAKLFGERGEKSPKRGGEIRNRTRSGSGNNYRKPLLNDTAT